MEYGSPTVVQTFGCSYSTHNYYMGSYLWLNCHCLLLMLKKMLALVSALMQRLMLVSCLSYVVVLCRHASRLKTSIV